MSEPNRSTDPTTLQECIIAVHRQKDGFYTVTTKDGAQVQNLCPDEIFCAVNSALVHLLSMKTLGYAMATPQATK